MVCRLVDYGCEPLSSDGQPFYIRMCPASHGKSGAGRETAEFFGLTRWRAHTDEDAGVCIYSGPELNAAQFRGHDPGVE
jgi:hypothetical protein